MTIQTENAEKGGKTAPEPIAKQESTMDETPANGMPGGSTFDFVTSVMIDETAESPPHSPSAETKSGRKKANTSSVQKRKSPSPPSFLEQNLIR